VRSCLYAARPADSTGACLSRRALLQVAAARELGSTAWIPVLMIYTQNDTFFGPALSKRLYEAWTEAGGIAEYHLLAPFKEDGHFLVDDPASVPVWSPIVMKFLDRHSWNGLATK
jgi:hypothetical protein